MSYPKTVHILLTSELTPFRILCCRAVSTSVLQVQVEALSATSLPSSGKAIHKGVLNTFNTFILTVDYGSYTSVTFSYVHMIFQGEILRGDTVLLAFLSVEIGGSAAQGIAHQRESTSNDELLTTFRAQDKYDIAKYLPSAVHACVRQHRSF